MQGINVIGHLKSSAGLGHTTRMFIQLLQRKGFDVAAFEVDGDASSEVADRPDCTIADSPDQLPFDRNLVIASLDRLPKLWVKRAPRLRAPRMRNAGLLFWELPVLPPAWVPSLRPFDVVLAPSEFVRQAVEAALPSTPTLFVEHPIPRTLKLTDRAATRRSLGLPDEATVFCASFDPRSSLSRKNPTGALRAWRRAFPSDPDVRLVIKSNGDPGLAGAHPDALEIAAAAAADERIVVVSQRLEHADVMALFACCDVFISLHRSEGLGLVPMEAMALGKVVVATGYSGNMTFMNEQNSAPVDYRLVEARGDSFHSRRFAGAGAVWAEPDLDHAAMLLQGFAHQRERREAVGRQASDDIRRRQDTAWEGDAIERMAALLDAAPARRDPLLSILAQELFDPTLRGNNVSALRRRWQG